MIRACNCETPFCRFWAAMLAFVCVWYIVASWQIRALKRRQNIMMPYCHLAWHAAALFILSTLRVQPVPSPPFVLPIPLAFSFFSLCLLHSIFSCMPFPPLSFCFPFAFFSFSLFLVFFIYITIKINIYSIYFVCVRVCVCTHARTRNTVKQGTKKERPKIAALKCYPKNPIKSNVKTK